MQPGSTRQGITGVNKWRSKLTVAVKAEAQKGKGLAITFIGSDEDSDVLNKVHERFEVEIKELPEQIDTSTYMPA